MVKPVYFATFFLQYEDRRRKTATWETPSTTHSPTDDVELDENHKKLSFSSSPGVELDQNHRKLSFSSSPGVELDENHRKVSFSSSPGVELDQNHRKLSFSSSPGVELDENHRKLSFSSSPGVELEENHKSGEKAMREKEINDLYRKKQQPSFTRTGKDWLKLGAFYMVTSLAATMFLKV